MLALIMAHPAAAGLIAYLILSAIVGSMPKLPEGSSYKARWAYGIAQALSMNLRFAANFFKVQVPPSFTDEQEKK